MLETLEASRRRLEAAWEPLEGAASRLLGAPGGLGSSRHAGGGHGRLQLLRSALKKLGISLFDASLKAF